ncbi:expressed unknown protein [Seminavis robusta]|uniref:Uncharacterized protein n=1 Tax=Seminavis robusta TaxID=568900 RepID=A0A9N8HWW9_9STRA|nr:expressed unknown protein [Seminavis robusta]|eukprot:Sro2824_g337991.1  (111) ;mRNA; r:654-986
MKASGIDKPMGAVMTYCTTKLPCSPFKTTPKIKSTGYQDLLTQRTKQELSTGILISPTINLLPSGTAEHSHQMEKKLYNINKGDDGNFATISAVYKRKKKGSAATFTGRS